jgi:mannose-6-phosphate isomerase-like protein (cupin superfamily)
VQDLTAAAIYTAADQAADPGANPGASPGGEVGTHWVEHLRVPAMSLGTYSIRAGATDDQTPHGEDEVYVVVSGRGAFEAGGARVDVGPGSTLFVPALEDHRFVDVTEDLTLIVVFAPAEGSVQDP